MSLGDVAMCVCSHVKDRVFAREPVFLNFDFATIVRATYIAIVVAGHFQ